MSEPSSSKQIAVVPREEITIDSITPEQITHQMNLIKQVMAQNMEKGHDYGVIPGTKGKKPTLLKPGAEKLCKLFFLAPNYDWQEKDLGNGHMDCWFVCTITQIHTGRVWGQGIGSCSTMEKKYRYRDGVSGGKIENPNLADQWNTIRKMGKKRAFVDAILTVTAASAIFTQDVGDEEEEDAGTKPGGKATGEATQGTEMIVGPDSEEVQVWRSYVKKVVPKSGQGAKGPWHMVGLVLPGGDQGDYWVSTFDKKLGTRAASFLNKACDVTVRPGSKEGTWDLLDITFPKISQAKEAPVTEQEVNGDNDELPIDYGETVEANPFNEQEE